MTENKITMADFFNQPRYVFNKRKYVVETADATETRPFIIYDKIYGGRLGAKLIEKIPALADKIDADAVYPFFVLGAHVDFQEIDETDAEPVDNTKTTFGGVVKKYTADFHYVFIYDNKNNILYINRNNDETKNKYVDCFQQETGATIVEIDAPCVKKTRRSTKIKVDNIDALLKIATTETDAMC